MFFYNKKKKNKQALQVLSYTTYNNNNPYHNNDNNNYYDEIEPDFTNKFTSIYSDQVIDTLRQNKKRLSDLAKKWQRNK